MGRATVPGIRDTPLSGAPESGSTDEQLMAAVCKGDQPAFNRLLDRHLDAVNGFLLRMTTGNRPLADDLSQETFLRVWQKAASYRPGRVKVSTWIHTIAHNLAVDHFRRRSEAAIDDATEPADPRGGPDDSLARQQSATVVHDMLDQLPLNQRNAVVLCHLRGFSNEDAAHVLGVGVRALESLLARGRRRLKQLMQVQRGAQAQ